MLALEWKQSLRKESTLNDLPIPVKTTRSGFHAFYMNQFWWGQFSPMENIAHTFKAKLGIRKPSPITSLPGTSISSSYTSSSQT